MEPKVAIQLGWTSVAALILFCNCVPVIRNRFFVYGARASASGDVTQKQSTTNAVASTNRRGITERLAGLQVPHSLFYTFYVWSLLCSSFWAAQLLSNGRILQSVIVKTDPAAPSMTIEQVIVIWCLMVAQGSRRLYECLYVTKERPSSSTMWIGHWLVGVAFYAAVSVSIWVEGSRAIAAYMSSPWAVLRPTMPSWEGIGALSLFCAASFAQFTCHAHLASLQGYVIPPHRLFRTVLCPHYTAECLIYLALSVLAAPYGQWYNRTLASVMIWVIVTLGVTADSTWSWYRAKFGVDRVGSRKRLMPFVY